MKRLLLGLVMIIALAGCNDVKINSEPEVKRESLTTSEATTISPEPVAAKKKTPRNFQLWKFDAPVVRIRLNGNELVPPDDPAILGWWGRKAGAPQGTILLTGHTVHTGGGELDDLELTKPGQIAKVSGREYKVDSVEVISKAALARRAPQLFNQNGEHKLVVVTCEGYDPATGHYADNVVVVARPK